jgi:tRNA (guanine-N7-)-methyltransferase
VGKDKLKRFRELESIDFVIQPSFQEVFDRDHPLKGNWKRDFFGNDRPLVLELGCGKGEYTVGLARQDPDRNFIGVDIKGSRIWKGAVQAREEGLKNVAFLRTRIDFINSFFGPGEVDDIWITFPDPQEKKRRRKKRLTGDLFLNRYRQFLVDGGPVRLKTDNPDLYACTLELVRFNRLPLERRSDNLHAAGWNDETVNIQTTYEKRFMEEGKTIYYLQFGLPSDRAIQPLPDDIEE